MKSSLQIFGGFRRLPISRAFSLVELLAVMAILSVLAVAALPSLRGTMDGFNISGAASLADAEILLARQTAMSRNLPVEVRIYKHDDGTGEAWRLMAVVIPDWASGKTEDEWITAGKVLPGNVAMDDSSDFSTVISKASGDAGPDKVAPWNPVEASTTSVPRLLRGKEYAGFLFNPDGSTNLPSDQPWCLTLKNPRIQPSGNVPAPNYVSIVLDSLTGRTLTYQP